MVISNYYVPRLFHERALLTCQKADEAGVGRAVPPWNPESL